MGNAIMMTTTWKQTQSHSAEGSAFKRTRSGWSLGIVYAKCRSKISKLRCDSEKAMSQLRTESDMKTLSIFFCQGGNIHHSLK